ncbi:hypothetical protein Cst04h_12300 [Corynebacterium striatum]|uniref:Secreted protein n=1 Tax=Corynebacterium striatum TaxID=43770 RepID=A0ABC9ZLP7_CORST|nr:hypothetical protein Cst04h_12300 [Corynebacterium striatum]
MGFGPAFVGLFSTLSCWSPSTGFPLMVPLRVALATNTAHWVSLPPKETQPMGANQWDQSGTCGNPGGTAGEKGQSGGQSARGRGD